MVWRIVDTQSSVFEYAISVCSDLCVHLPGVSEIIFAGAKNAAPERSLALPLRRNRGRNPLYAGDTSRLMRSWSPLSPAYAVLSTVAIIIMSYYSLRLDAQQLAPVIVSCWRHCLALQKPPLAPRNSYWRSFRRHSARLTPLACVNPLNWRTIYCQLKT